MRHRIQHAVPSKRIELLRLSREELVDAILFQADVIAALKTENSELQFGTRS